MTLDEDARAYTKSPAWYAIWTRSRHEKVVRDELISKGIEPFLPTLTTVNQWKDRRQKVDVPLFPGYCFARMGRADRLRVLQSRGVIELVGNAHGAIPIPDGEIEQVKRLASSGLPYAAHADVREGMPVKVIRGPLEGLHGSLIRVAAQCRLLIAVRLIEQAAVVELDAASVIPVDGALARATTTMPPRVSHGSRQFATIS